MNRFRLNPARFLLYIFGKLLALALAAAFVVFAFFTALNSMNVYMVAKDAVTKRTSVILDPVDNKDSETLDTLFTEKFLMKSGLKTQTANASYLITNYDERADIAFAIVFPWQDSAEVQAKDMVQSIKAKVSSSAIDFNPVSSFIDSGVYKIRAVKDEEGMWKIDDMELTEKLKPTNVLPIPTPEPSSDADTADEAGLVNGANQATS